MTLSELQEWLAGAPPGTMLPADSMLSLLNGIPNTPTPVTLSPPTEPTWRERLWTAPSDARIGTAELAEALGRPPSWIYRHTSARSCCAPIPHRKLDGELVFLVGEVRQWVEDHEDVVVRGRTGEEIRKKIAVALS